MKIINITRPARTISVAVMSNNKKTVHTIQPDKSITGNFVPTDALLKMAFISREVAIFENSVRINSPGKLSIPFVLKETNSGLFYEMDTEKDIISTEEDGVEAVGDLDPLANEEVSTEAVGELASTTEPKRRGRRPKDGSGR